MEENNKVFTLQPLSKWKRILLSLGDYFITFILSFVLFNLAVFPLAKVICNTSAKNNEATVMETKADALLIDNGILLRKEGNSKFAPWNEANNHYKEGNSKENECGNLVL